MTQLSTVARDKARHSAPATPVVMASIAGALVVGIGLGLLVSNVGAISPARETNQFSALTHEQFLRLNTEDLGHLAPLDHKAAAFAPSDPFMAMNVDSYEWPAQANLDRHKVGSHFYEINTSGLERAAFDVAIPTGLGDNIIRNSEPAGYPNNGRLETYLGAQPTSGVR